MLIQLESGDIINTDTISVIEDRRQGRVRVRFPTGNHCILACTEDDWSRICSFIGKGMKGPDYTSTDIDVFRKRCGELGIAVDKRWIRRTLLEKIEAAETTIDEAAKAAKAAEEKVNSVEEPEVAGVA